VSGREPVGSRGALDLIPVGEQTRARACLVLEQQLGAVWTAVLESHGLDPGAGCRVVLEGLALAPGGAPEAARPAPAEPAWDGPVLLPRER
jgi:hypothetical protein